VTAKWAAWRACARRDCDETSRAKFMAAARRHIDFRIVLIADLAKNMFRTRRIGGSYRDRRDRRSRDRCLDFVHSPREIVIAGLAVEKRRARR
jgi:hypothetical protein